MSRRAKETPAPARAQNTAAAAAVLGLPEEVLIAARAAGCMAFRNSIVYLDELREWLVDNPDAVSDGLDEDDSKETEAKWRIEKNKKACRALDLKYEQEIGELVPRSQLREALAQAFAPLCVVLEKNLDRPTYNLVCKQLREALAEVDVKTSPKKKA